jgi:hypothetical protein
MDRAMSDASSEHRARAMLRSILAALAERNVRPTPLAVIAAATDAGADDELASAVAAAFEQMEPACQR